MKRFIRYLYEYEQRRCARNVGFVKVEESTDDCVIHIHAKGLRMDETKEIELCLLIETERGIEKIPQGEIHSLTPTMNVKFVFNREDLPDENMFDHVAGLLLEDGTQRKYMATWEGVQAEATQIPTYRPDYVPVESPKQDEKEEESLMEPVLEDTTEEKEESSAEEKEIPSMVQMVEEPYDVIRSEGVFDSGEKQKVPIQRYRAEKIQRNDLVKLARCEWQLANNRFLLHGYYNYHHLVYIEDGNRLLLGVPGIYHEQEAAAAESFGFGAFLGKEELDIRSDLNEPVEEEKFGYWIRPVKSVNYKMY